MTIFGCVQGGAAAFANGRRTLAIGQEVGKPNVAEMATLGRE